MHFVMEYEHGEHLDFEVWHNFKSEFQYQACFCLNHAMMNSHVYLDKYWRVSNTYSLW